MTSDKRVGSSPQGSSPLEREADHVDGLMNGHRVEEPSKEAKEGASGLNNPVQVAQDNRVEKAKADAVAAGGGPNKPEDGLNQDG